MSPLWPLHAVASLWRERHKRSPQWHTLEVHFLTAHPTCAACGGWLLLQVHHVVPVHVDPDRELEWKNLIALCMGTKSCHLKVGHLGSWLKYNPSVRLDAQRQLDTLRRGGRP